MKKRIEMDWEEGELTAIDRMCGRAVLPNVLQARGRTKD
jgi:hypothetical protein